MPRARRTATCSSSTTAPTPPGRRIPCRYGPSTKYKSTPTLQAVVNPLIRRGSPIHDNVYSALRELDIDCIRFIPWFPYPKLGVAELEPPSDGGTSWDFSLIDPLVEDFQKATRGKLSILNFNTIPEWMWQPHPWNVQDGALHVVGGGNALAASGSGWTDYTFAVDVTPWRPARRTEPPTRKPDGWSGYRTPTTATPSASTTTGTAKCS